MKIKQFGNIDVKEWFMYLFAFLFLVQVMAGVIGTLLNFMYAMFLLGISAAGAVILYKELMKKGQEKKYKQGDLWLAISLIIVGIVLYMYILPPSAPMALYSVLR